MLVCTPFDTILAPYINKSERQQLLKKIDSNKNRSCERVDNNKTIKSMNQVIPN